MAPIRTEWDYGYDYAKWIHNNDIHADELVDITIPIPDGDYTEMVADGIDNPNNSRYWNGFNSFHE